MKDVVAPFNNQAFHSSANLRKTAFLARAENFASVNFLHGRIHENPRSHPIELPSLVQDSLVAIYQGFQDFRTRAQLSEIPRSSLSPCPQSALVAELKAPSRNQFMRNSERRKQSRRLLEWPEI